MAAKFNEMSPSRESDNLEDDIADKNGIFVSKIR